MGNLRGLVNCSTFLSGAFYPYGKPRRVLQLWQEKGFELVISEEIFKEYKEKIEPVARRMKKDSPAAEFYLDLVATEATFVIPKKLDPKICRDPNDLKYLEAAASADADFLISSDKDLLALKTFGKTQIVTPNKFLKAHF